MPGHSDQTFTKQDGVGGKAARLSWMFFGNVVIAFSIAAIVLHKGAQFYTVDAVFWITVPILAVARYIDIRFLGGLTATGLPASMIHWRRYVILLLVLSAAAWSLAHAANYLFVNR